MTVKKLYVGDIRIAGIEGKSAYQVWLDAGNTGTEEDYLASLKGDTGATGPQGPAGQDGSDAEVTVTNITNALGYTPASQDSDAIAGNIAMFDSLGNPEDSGIPAENVAEQDGYYETMVVGGAENLIGNDIVSSQFIRRKTGGTADVGTGVAILKTIKGNTLVWNQLLQNGNFATATLWTADNSATVSISNNIARTTATQAGSISFKPGQGNILTIANHKYLISVWVRTSVNTVTAKLSTAYVGTEPSTTSTTWTHLTVLSYRASDLASPNYPRILISNAVINDWVEVKNFYLIDLTQMFGAGNEPSTAAEFEAMFPLNYYAYDSGSLLNLTATGLQTDGFNQWDEEWEVGKFNTTTGEPEAAATQIRSKNYIPVFGNTDYYFQFPLGVGNLVIMRYDIDKNYLGYNAIQPSTQTLSTDTRFIRFYMTVSYGTTYNHDICINLSDVNKNGTYEPYWSETKALPITTATSGGVAIFSDGMKSAGTAHDEMTTTKATKRIGVVDMGTLNYSPGNYSGTNNWRIYGYLTGIKRAADNYVKANIVSDRFIAASNNETYLHSADKSLSGITNADAIYIYDSALFGMTANQIKAALSGVYLYYELATPTEYTLDTPLNLQYRVDNDGTETILPENTSTPTTSPIVADINYALNAIDTIRNLPQNYISKASMDAILTAFKTAGVITNYTLTWDATNQKYNCSITA